MFERSNRQVHKISTKVGDTFYSIKVEFSEGVFQNLIDLHDVATSLRRRKQFKRHDLKIASSCVVAMTFIEKNCSCENLK